MSDQEFDVRIGRLEVRVEAVAAVVDTQNRRLEAVESRMDNGFRELRRQIFWLGSIQISCLLAMLGLVAKIGHLF